jgi:Flp pilus assembly protein TadB
MRQVLKPESRAKLAASRKRLEKRRRDWWDALTDRATNKNVNKWPQLKARVQVTCWLMVLGVAVWIVTAVIAALWIVCGLFIAVGVQVLPIRATWANPRKLKEPPIVR